MSFFKLQLAKLTDISNASNSTISRVAPVASHFAGSKVSLLRLRDNIEILVSTNKGVSHLKMFEALYVREIRSFINT
jgi:hypothetical protein